MKTKNRIKYCSEPSCGKKMIYLLNVKTLKYVPVDYDTLTNDEQNAVEGNVSVMIIPITADEGNTLENSDLMLCFNNQHHTSHFKTCTKPNLFSSSKKEGKNNES